MTLVHWDEVETVRRSAGHISATWAYLGAAAGSIGAAVNRVRVEPGRWSTPAHVEATEEEIFFVLDGSGLSWQDGTVYEVGPGDCIVHRVREEAHTLRGGPGGLDYLVFGERVRGGGAHLPRAGVSWLWPSWVEAGGGDTPWEREVEAGEPEVGEPGERPANVVNLEDAPSEADGAYRPLADAAGSERTGLNHVVVPPGRTPAPAHCHSAEEEIFVVLDGAGTLELVPSPRQVSRGVKEEQHPVRAGHVVSRPAGTGIAHAFRAGDSGLTLLMYGTREPNDIAYYPRSNKVNIRGVGLIGRLEPLDYWDGEELA